MYNILFINLSVSVLIQHPSVITKATLTNEGDQENAIESWPLEIKQTMADILQQVQASVFGPY